MSNRRKTFGYLVIGIGVLVVGGWIVTKAGFGAEPEGVVEGVPVLRGPLKISVVERGNLKAAGSVDLKSEIEGQTTVLWLIEEGKYVEPGDKLCELDTADLVERRVQQEIVVQNIEAEYVKAQQNLAIQESQNESDIKRAERDREFAGADLTKYLEGDWPQQRQQAEEDIVIADEELTRARQELEWSQKLFERGFLEQTQLDADRLAETQATIKLNRTKRALLLLEEHDFPRQRAELDADVEELGRELERVKLQARARLVDYEANLRSSKARLDLESEKLVKLDSQIEKAILVAPVAGMVVYAVEERGRWGGGEPMQEGTSVRERQKIITIPSSEGFVAEASLHESVLEMVNVGQPCVVTVDALADRALTGRVKFKALLPDQQSFFSNPDLRVYRAQIEIVEIDERLRPGMSCSVEILVEELQDALHVPVQSIFLDGGKPIAFVREAGDTAKRPVEVGENNGRFVHLKSGLEEGEIVLLSQPPGFSLEPARERSSGTDWEGVSAGQGSAGGASAGGPGRTAGQLGAEGGRQGGWSGGKSGDHSGARSGARSEGSSGGPPSGSRPSGDRSSGDRSSGGRPSGERPSGGRPSGGGGRGTQ